jgi:DNA-binding HxlR family transcriptional regulator
VAQTRARPSRGDCVAMRRTRFDASQCPIARTTDLIGDGWNPIVMREAFIGRRRFDQFQTARGVSRGVLTHRLTRLVDDGLLEKRGYEDLLTDKGAHSIRS